MAAVTPRCVLAMQLSVALSQPRYTPQALRMFEPFLLVFPTVMDVTDIITGKMDDEDKQHFIPFQP